MQLLLKALLVIGILTMTPLAHGQDTPSNQTPAEESQADEPCIPQSALDAYIQLRWERRVDQWNEVSAPLGAVVFVGSSIIEEGEWSALFPDVATVNRGIGADTTQGVLDRLDQIIALEPAKVFLYIGGNDFSRLGDSPEASIDRLKTILGELNTALPDTPIFVHSLFPREQRFADKIKAYNEMLLELDQNAGVTTIDVFPWFAQPDGSIDPRYANDGIHLSGEAYRIWADRISNYVLG